MASATHFWRSVRAFRNILPFSGSREEKVNFVKFDGNDADEHHHHQQQQQLQQQYKETAVDDSLASCQANGTKSYTASEITAVSAPDLDKYNGLFNRMEMEETEVRSVDGGRKRDQITALQAGWNVTNAIQVRLNFYCLHRIKIFVSIPSDIGHCQTCGFYRRW